MKIRIQHRTTYHYNQPVTFGQHKIMVRPREGHDVHIESSVLEISPPARTIRWMRDVNGNSLAKIDFQESAAQLTFYSELVLNQYDVNPFDFVLNENAVSYPFVYDADSLPELTVYMAILYPRDSVLLREWLKQFWKPGDQIETIVLLQNLNNHIHGHFQYVRRDETGVQTPAETLKKNSGSCRDFATLLLEACRCLGLAARFASGYMLCDATEAGGASTHAWMEVYLPGAGWKGFDPTSGAMTGPQHVTVAVSRNPENAAPIAGTFHGAPNAFRRIVVDVKVVQADRPQPVAPPVPILDLATSDASGERTFRQVEQVPQLTSEPEPTMDMVIRPAPPQAVPQALSA